MVRAVCFGQKAISEEGFARIIRETGAEDGGVLCFTLPVNCVESFPNGTIYRSHVLKENLKGVKAVIDCGDDVERFIYVNSYGRKARPDYDELVQMYQEGEISIIDFIEAQEELSQDYHDWIRQRREDRSVENANLFLEEQEKLLTQESHEYVREDGIIFMLT